MTNQQWTVTVDAAVCEGNAVCERLERSVFEVDEESDVVVIKTQPTTPEVLERVELAVRRCPKQALKLVSLPAADSPSPMKRDAP